MGIAGGHSPVTDRGQQCPEAEPRRPSAASPLAPLDRSLLLAAGAQAEPMLRALGAIHAASAVDLGPVHAYTSYDERQSAAARLAGLRTMVRAMAPGM